MWEQNSVVNYCKEISNLIQTFLVTNDHWDFLHNNLVSAVMMQFENLKSTLTSWQSAQIFTLDSKHSKHSELALSYFEHKIEILSCSEHFKSSCHCLVSI